jgi:hypothetical protein
LKPVDEKYCLSSTTSGELTSSNGEAAADVFRFTVHGPFNGFTISSAFDSQLVIDCTDKQEPKLVWRDYYYFGFNANFNAIDGITGAQMFQAKVCVWENLCVKLNNSFIYCAVYI